MTRSERMPPHSKQVLDRGVDTEESLSLPGGCKPTHPPFPLPGPLVGNLGSVVLVPTRLVRNGREQFSMSSAVASRFVGDESVWNRALPLREATKEPLRCCRVSPFRHQNVECVAVLIDRTPKVERFSLNLHEEFVDVPAPNPDKTGFCNRISGTGSSEIHLRGQGVRGSKCFRSGGSTGFGVGLPPGGGGSGRFGGSGRGGGSGRFGSSGRGGGGDGGLFVFSLGISHTSFGM
jgi:hypothetical protein